MRGQPPDTWQIAILAAVIAALIVMAGWGVVHQVKAYLERRRNWRALSPEAQTLILEIELILEEAARR